MAGEKSALKNLEAKSHRLFWAAYVANLQRLFGPHCGWEVHPVLRVLVSRVGLPLSGLILVKNWRLIQKKRKKEKFKTIQKSWWLNTQNPRLSGSTLQFIVMCYILLSILKQKSVWSKNCWRLF